MKITRRSLLFGCLARAWPQNQPTFSTDVSVVSLLATVRDKNGRVVKDLNPDDFVLLEDGVPQRIRYFSQETNLPLTIGLLVDTSRSQIGVVRQEARASWTFLQQVLRPERDQAFVAEFDERVQVLQGLTSSLSDLAQALRRLSIPNDEATLIYSAIRKCAEDVMRKEVGRKAFILLTDGVAYRDNTSIDTAIEFAQRSDTILYSIRFSGAIQTSRPARAAILAAAEHRGKEGLMRMAKETGGETFDVSKGQGIDEIYSKIEDALRNQYSIGYTPEKSGTPGAYHEVKLSVKERRLVVTTREGYYGR